LGQVTNGWKYTNSTAITDHEFAYLFDDIGNRKKTITSAITNSYTANLLNQYTAVGGQVWTNDPDGNLLVGGGWTNTWDAENRLLTMTTNGQKLAFAYDWQGRRVQKQVWNNTAGTGVPVVDQRFVYDGWNLIAVVSPPSTVLQSFTWGTDLSGTMQGAGGVGGLLALSCRGAQTTNCFAAYDGNGNVVALINSDDATIAAQYEYGPFGEMLRATGSMVKANPFRFSSKFQDDESDLLCFGYRYYNPAAGRWLSPDPLGEWDSPGVYTYVCNAPAGATDMLGLSVNGQGIQLDQIFKLFWMAFKDTLKVPFVQPTVKIIETDQCCNCAGHNYKRNTVTVGIKLNIKYIQISVAGLGSQCGPCKEPICFSVSASVSVSGIISDLIAPGSSVITQFILDARLGLAGTYCYPSGWKKPANVTLTIRIGSWYSWEQSTPLDLSGAM